MTAPAEPAEPDPQRLMEVLRFLAELARVVASNTEMQPILDFVVAGTTRLLAADEGCIRLSNPGAGMSGGRTVVRKGREGIVSGSWPPAVAMSVEGYLAGGRDFLVSSDLTHDPSFNGLRGLDTRVRAILAVPLRVDNHMTGVLAVTEVTPGRQWDGSDLQTLSIIAGNSAGVIEQARLRAVEIEAKRQAEERERQEKELRQASEIQRSFLPSRLLAASPWEVLGRVVPARHVGGDAFDYYRVDSHRIGLAIADVSGKGVSAALLMSRTQGWLRECFDGDRPVAEGMRELNRDVAPVANGKFITFFYGELDLGSGRMRFTNAGHNYPILRRADGAVQFLEEGGLPLGLFESTEYAQGEVTLVPGDALLLYSDGVTEALDPLRRQYGEERLVALWKSLAGAPASRAVERVMDDVQTFRSSAEPSDDVTVLVLSAASGT